MDIKKFINWKIKGIKHKFETLSKGQKRILALLIATLVVGGVLGGLIGRWGANRKAEKEIARVTAEIAETEQQKTAEVQKKLDRLQRQTEGTDLDLPWNLTLVNSTHAMEKGYVPELVELKSGYKVDARIADAAKKMLRDAKKAGMKIVICSAYRSVERQEQVFNDSMKDRLNEGMGYLEAYQDTATNVALPGTSEHALGLSLDLISNQYSELDERQETTKEAKWLEENCYKYGFILRYPPEKMDITGIIYEPWHYRYVGVEHATKIMQLDVTLEEYLEEHYEP